MHMKIIFLYLCFLYFMAESSSSSSSTIQNYTRYKQISSLRLERINNHLENINKVPVLTIEVMLFIVINVSVCYSGWDFNVFVNKPLMYLLNLLFVWFWMKLISEPRWRSYRLCPQKKTISFGSPTFKKSQDPGNN